MSDFTLTRRRIRTGRYEGLLAANGRRAGRPELELRFLDSSLGHVQLTPDPEDARKWEVRATIPAHALNEGVQTFVIADAKSGEVLDSFAIICGEPLEEDIRAELALLRAELDMLKAAFRRHVRDGRA